MVKSVFEQVITTEWTKIVDFDKELGRKAGQQEGFEVYCESQIKIEFGIGTETESPPVVAFTLQPKLVWKYILGTPVRGVLYARSVSATPTVHVEV